MTIMTGNFPKALQGGKVATGAKKPFSQKKTKSPPVLGTMYMKKGKRGS